MKGKKNWKVVVLMTMALLALSAGQVFAAVTPSVSQNPAPKVVGAATYTDASGQTTTINASDVKIVADGDVTKLTPEQKVIYEKAKSELVSADSQYTKDLATFLKENFTDLQPENVIVREIFDINLGQDFVFDNGQKLELTLSGTYKAGDTVIVTVFNKETGKWDFIESGDVKVNADGSLTVKFPHLCPVAILVTDQGAETAAVTPTEAGGSNLPMLLLAVGVGVVVLAAVVFVILKKKKTA